MKRIEVLKCDYCTSISQTEEYIKRHENNCLANPINRSCATCLWYSYYIPMHEECCFVNARSDVKSIVRSCSKWVWREILPYLNVAGITLLINKDVPWYKLTLANQELNRQKKVIQDLKECFN